MIFVITPDGRKIYDALFAYTLKRHVKSFLVIQKRVELIEIYIVRDQLYSENTEKEYLNILHKALGDGIKLQVFHVDELPRESSGKLRYFRSEVSANKQVDTHLTFK
jgi:phenylacetate-CoA ligase